MKRSSDPLLKRDLLKIACLTTAVLSIFATIQAIPGFSIPTLMSVIAAILLSPLVAALERRGTSRLLAILGLFVGIMITVSTLGYLGIQAALKEWGSLQSMGPQYFARSMGQLRSLETLLSTKLPIFAATIQAAHPTEKVLGWGTQTAQWIQEHGPSLMSHLLTWIFVVPPLTLILLNEGPTLRKRFFQLVPNRFFELFFLISNEIFNGISDYLRAKLLQGFLMGIMTTIGLAIVGAPYAIFLGVLSGVTNIVPYVGPFLSAVPAIIFASFDATNPTLTYSVALVFILVNIIDTIVVFPLVVAKLVNLHPVILIAVVAIGQQYAGLTGMLISIPVATAIKVVLEEIYYAVYERRAGQAPTMRMVSKQST